MQLTTTTLLVLAAGVLALPPSGKQELDMTPVGSDQTLASKGPCGGLQKKAACCSKSILGIIDVNCSAGPSDAKTGLELATACGAAKKLPRCCILGLLGLYVACKPPADVAAELGIET
ncbi:hypothetical protein Daus18300_003063 [Diaporthe australafricana]|uniref:Hydrophobin n=1 Tax=Diaporthe australafricana TaxID=127596 RepID=A0ABR3XK28_9PEZI